MATRTTSGNARSSTESVETASSQPGATRPTLDHLAELACKAIVRAGRKGVLPLKCPDSAGSIVFGEAVRR